MPTLLELLAEKTAAAPAEVAQAALRGEMPAMAIEPAVRQYAASKTMELVESGRLAPGMARQHYSQLLNSMQKDRGQLEDVAYRRGAGGELPVSLGDIGTSVALGTGMTWGLNRVGRLFDKARKKKPSPAMGLKDAFKFTFSPKFIPVAAGIGLASSALNPLQDPKWQRGERGFFDSWKEGVRGSAEEFRRKGQEARQQYGLLGLPVQAFHVLTDPMAAGAAALGVGKQASARAQQAIRQALSTQH